MKFFGRYNMQHILEDKTGQYHYILGPKLIIYIWLNQLSYSKQWYVIPILGPVKLQLSSVTAVLWKIMLNTVENQKFIN